MNTYAPLPVSFVRGAGAWLWDENGKQYLDAISGLGVCALGHAHPALARVISEQSATLIHTGNLVHIPWQEKLAAKYHEDDQVLNLNSCEDALTTASLRRNRYIASAAASSPSQTPFGEPSGLEANRDA